MGRAEKKVQSPFWLPTIFTPRTGNDQAGWPYSRLSFSLLPRSARNFALSHYHNGRLPSVTKSVTSKRFQKTFLTFYS